MAQQLAVGARDVAALHLAREGAGVAAFGVV